MSASGQRYKDIWDQVIWWRDYFLRKRFTKETRDRLTREKRHRLVKVAMRTALRLSIKIETALGNHETAAMLKHNLSWPWT